jgi:Putative DNA-binding domain
MSITRDYEALSIQTLQQYLAERQEENLHLDFKRVTNSGLTNRDDRKNLACALSGFANASGGLVIWGVDARKNDDGTDCVVALPGVENVAALVTRLNQLTGEAVDPIVNGIQHRVVGVFENNRGFGVTLVPESDGGPHMAKLGENRFYKRSGDSFYPMEHYDLADMFGRRRKPRLEFKVYARNPGPEAELILGLKNSGRASAKAPYLRVDAPAPFSRNRYGVDGNQGEGLPWLKAQTKGRQWHWGASADLVIHPGVTLEIASLTRSNNVTPIPAEGIALSYAMACEGQALVEGQLIIPWQDLNPP